jgi:hypothetical protein
MASSFPFLNVQKKITHTSGHFTRFDRKNIRPLSDVFLDGFLGLRDEVEGQLREGSIYMNSPDARIILDPLPAYSSSESATNKSNMPSPKTHLPF